MDRVDDVTKSTDLFGSGKHGYTEGSPGIVDPTRVRDTALNGFQEEIVRTIEGAGLSPDANDLGQLNAAVKLHLRRFALSNWDVVPMSSARYDAICYGGGQWLAVGVNGAIATSPNGLVWTAQTPDASSTAHWLACAYSESLGMYVIAGDGAEIQTSTDGVTWTARTPGSGYAGTFRGAAWIGDKFCLVGDDEGGNAYAQTSPDGVTWTRRTIAASAHTLTAVAYDSDSDLVVAVGNTGSARYIYTTSDGIVWANQVNAAADSLYTVAYNPVLGLWVAAGKQSAILTSPDGITWTARTAAHSGTSSQYTGACVTSDGVFVLCGYNTFGDDKTYVAHSHDGITWSGVNVYDDKAGTALYCVGTDDFRHIVMGEFSAADFVLRSHAFAG